MPCDPWRELVSARLDGELSGPEDAALDDHLRGCAACRGYAQQAGALGRLVRVRPAEAVPDLTHAILAAAAPERPSLAHRWARWALAWVAVVQLALALPALVLGEDTGAAPHVARHLGSFDVALAIGFLVAAWRPARAGALLPVTLVLAALLALTSLADLVDGSTTGGVEARHVIDLVAIGLLWVVAGSPRPGQHRLPAAAT